jgi:hypothetical protein
MSKIPFMLIPLVEYAMPITLGTAIALRLFKKQITGDLVISSGLPICLWLVLVLALPGKSLSNFVIEPLILASAILALEVARLALDRRGLIKDGTLATLNIAGSLLFTLCILFFIPPLPE